jgi:hypothetical protein
VSRGLLDDVALEIIRACRARIVDAVMPIIEGVADDLIEEGHAEVLVCQAQVSAVGEMLGHSILDLCEPADAPKLWQETAALVGQFVETNAAIEADVAAGARPPVGVMVQ